MSIKPREINEVTIVQAISNTTDIFDLYSPPVDSNVEVVILEYYTLNNVTDSPVNVTVYLNPTGGTFSDEHIVQSKLEIQPGNPYDRVVKLPMRDANGKLAYKTSIADSVAISVTGKEIKVT
jgi:hypothetical protein